MKNEVRCPHCGRRLLDAEMGVQTKTKVIDPYDLGPPKNRWKPDYYTKCWKCHSTVGYKKIEDNLHTSY